MGLQPVPDMIHRRLLPVGRLTAVALAAGLVAATLTASTFSPRAVATTSTSAAAPSLAARLDAVIRAEVANHSFRGSVLVARGARILLEHGYGGADLTRRLADTPTTRFRIGSLTKSFTALAILKLAALGKLQVNDRICRYLTDCPSAWAPITIQELLTHTSGIPDYTNLPGYSVFSRRHLTPARLVALVRSRPLLFPPGSQWRYSNSGYAILGAIIERASGRPYAQFLRQAILAPLGLHDTGYDVDHPQLPQHATGYSGWRERAPYIDMSVPYAAGALYSTVGDLYRFDQDLRTNRPAIVPAALLRTMFTPHVAIDPSQPKSVAYGYGWFIAGHGPSLSYSHDGDINGFVSYNELFPHSRVTIVVLSNLESSDVRDLVDGLAAIANDGHRSVGAVDSRSHYAARPRRSFRPDSSSQRCSSAHAARSSSRGSSASPAAVSR